MIQTAAAVADRDLAHLPEPARRHLRFAGVVGRPIDTFFEMRAHGWFRRRPTDRWTSCHLRQRNTAPEISRDFHLHLTAGHLLPIHAVDGYDHGHGRMHATTLGVFTVADARGAEMDQAELVTYLDDAILFAPSTLLRLPVAWTAVDDHAYEVTLTDHDTTVTARVTVDDRGAPREVSTDDRWADLPTGLTKVPWSTPVDGWVLVADRMRPRRACAVWHLPEGRFTYAQFEFTGAEITYG
ncbi:hypothetical protein GCM10022243_34750 [Saccharothrix violaceirubra]|uniref:Uncharacterized protein n=1 Tax=Saccharothrix violaceirubra TaxID=413306 RepID=A0A7W7WWZ8_9PSEU|nr:DUF6544 family protein [Saccharothrix violaceirubra]MBB4966527.1 hypothetical protein [Saccharothrix violaceirubra]